MPARLRAHLSKAARPPTITIVGAERLPELAALEGLAAAVFGRGQRRAGWFQRKLLREGVEAPLSSVALAQDQQLHGYVLLGRSASLGVLARGAGIGVVPSSRGRGLGRALLEHAVVRARAAGCEAIEFLAEPARLGWYLRQEFAIVEEQLTLLTLGTGEPGASFNPPEREPPARAQALWSWIPEVWERTPAAERAYVELGGARLWLTKEGRAWLVHRCELDDPAALAPCVAALRQRLAPTTPLLLYPCPAASPWTDALLRAGLRAAQRSFVVRREVGPGD